MIQPKILFYPFPQLIDVIRVFSYQDLLNMHVNTHRTIKQLIHQHVYHNIINIYLFEEC